MGFLVYLLYSQVLSLYGFCKMCCCKGVLSIGSFTLKARAEHLKQLVQVVDERVQSQSEGKVRGDHYIHHLLERLTPVWKTGLQHRFHERCQHQVWESVGKILRWKTPASTSKRSCALTKAQDIKPVRGTKTIKQLTKKRKTNHLTVASQIEKI